MCPVLVLPQSPNHPLFDTHASRRAKLTGAAARIAPAASAAPAPQLAAPALAAAALCGACVATLFFQAPAHLPPTCTPLLIS
jgi:hypothetical protein